jgi:hypothetical protein
MFTEAREHRGSELERVGDARGSVCFLARNDVEWHVRRAINSTTSAHTRAGEFRYRIPTPFERWGAIGAKGVWTGETDGALAKTA